VTVVQTSMTFDRSAKLDERQVRTYRIVARVRTDSVDDGPGTILAAVIERGIDIGEFYREPNGYFDLGARCQSIEPKVDQDNPLLWVVDCMFTSEPPRRTALGERGYRPSRGQRGGRRLGGSGGGLRLPEGDRDGRSRDPANRDDEYEWSYTDRRKVISAAHLVVDGIIQPAAPIANSAGFPFDPLPEIDDSRLTLTISRNEKDYDPRIAFTYGDKLNADPFFDFAPYTAKMRPPVARRFFEDGEFWWRVTYKIEFRTEEPFWEIELLDAGYHALAGLEDVPYRIPDRDGNPVNEPWPLDGAGGQLEPDAEPVYRRFRPVEYTAVPFAPLEL
jgi:hypothetical protein